MWQAQRIIMTFCGNCGADNPEGNRFCFNCGAELSVAPEEPKAGYSPVMSNEIERIGAYDPNVNYYVPPQAHQEQRLYQPPYEQQYPPQQPQYGQQYQQPPVPAPQQQMPPQQNYHQQQYPQQPQYQQIAQYQHSQYAAMGYPQQQYGKSKEPVYLYGAPNNSKGARYAGMVLPIVGLILVLVAMFVIPTGKNAADSTLFSLGTSDVGLPILIFVIMSIAMGVVSVITPIFSVVSGVCVIATAAIVHLKVVPQLPATMDVNTFIMFIGIAVGVMIIGILATVMMNKYVRSNVRNVTMFQCCIMSWKGVRVPEGAQIMPPAAPQQPPMQQMPPQQPQYGQPQYGQPQYQQPPMQQMPPQQPPRPPYQY